MKTLCNYLLQNRFFFQFNGIFFHQWLKWHIKSSCFLSKGLNWSSRLIPFDKLLFQILYLILSDLYTFNLHSLRSHIRSLLEAHSYTSVTVALFLKRWSGKPSWRAAEVQIRFSLKLESLYGQYIQIRLRASEDFCSQFQFSRVQNVSLTCRMRLSFKEFLTDHGI